MVHIIEITTSKIGNMQDTFPAFVQQRFGNRPKIICSFLVDGKVEGTVQQSDGTCFDVVWSGERYKVLEA